MPSKYIEKMRNVKGRANECTKPLRSTGSRSLCPLVSDDRADVNSAAGPAAAGPAHASSATGATADGADAGKREGPGALDGVTQFIGMRWRDPETVTLEIRPQLMNRGGLLSGVVTYALVDYCMGSTLWVQTSREEHIATMNISINYIQTATSGEIVCRSTLDRRNRSSAMLRSEIRHDDGRLLVTAVGSYAIFPARKRPLAPPAAVEPSAPSATPAER